MVTNRFVLEASWIRTSLHEDAGRLRDSFGYRAPVPIATGDTGTWILWSAPGYRGRSGTWRPGRFAAIARVARPAWRAKPRVEGGSATRGAAPKAPRLVPNAPLEHRGRVHR